MHPRHTHPHLKVTRYGYPLEVTGLGPDGAEVHLHYEDGHARITVDGETAWQGDLGPDALGPETALRLAAAAADLHCVLRDIRTDEDPDL